MTTRRAAIVGNANTTQRSARFADRICPASFYGLVPAAKGPVIVSGEAALAIRSIGALGARVFRPHSDSVGGSMRARGVLPIGLSVALSSVSALPEWAHWQCHRQSDVRRRRMAAPAAKLASFGGLTDPLPLDRITDGASKFQKGVWRTDCGHVD